MQKVARGMDKFRVGIGLGLGADSLGRRAPPAHIRHLAGGGLLRLHVPGNNLPIFALFLPEQGYGVGLSSCCCSWPLQAEDGSKVAPVFVHVAFRSRLVEIVESALRIADEIRGQPIGNLVKRKNLGVTLLYR